MKAKITTWTYSGYAEDGTWLDGDRRTIREPEESEYIPDEYDIEEAGSAPMAVVIHLMKMGPWEASSYPLGDAEPEHVWITHTYDHPYRSETEETIVRLYDCTEEQRAVAFKALTA